MQQRMLSMKPWTATRFFRRRLGDADGRTKRVVRCAARGAIFARGAHIHWHLRLQHRPCVLTTRLCHHHRRHDGCHPAATRIGSSEMHLCNRSTLLPAGLQVLRKKTSASSSLQLYLSSEATPRPPINFFGCYGQCSCSFARGRARAAVVL